jgi:hypothetical protein
MFLVSCPPACGPGVRPVAASPHGGRSVARGEAARQGQLKGGEMRPRTRAPAAARAPAPARPRAAAPHGGSVPRRGSVAGPRSDRTPAHQSRTPAGVAEPRGARVSSATGKSFHSTERAKLVTVYYCWHPLCGQIARVRRGVPRSTGEVLFCELPDGAMGSFARLDDRCRGVRGPNRRRVGRVDRGAAGALGAAGRRPAPHPGLGEGGVRSGGCAPR